MTVTRHATLLQFPSKSLKNLCNSGCYRINLKEIKEFEGMPVAYLYMSLLIVSAPRLENENKNVT